MVKEVEVGFRAPEAHITNFKLWTCSLVSGMGLREGLRHSLGNLKTDVGPEMTEIVVCLKSFLYLIDNEA